MGFMDKVGIGLEQAAWEIERALDRGKTKVGELQAEMRMDGLAKKLGYLVFDFYRGRTVDQTERQKVLDELTRLEDQLYNIRAEAAAKAEADAQAREARKEQPPASGSGSATGADASGGGYAAPDGYYGAPGDYHDAPQEPSVQPFGWDEPPRLNP